MKNIKNLIITSIVLLIFASCEDSDNIFEYVSSDTTRIVGTISTTQTIIDQNTAVEFEFTLPQSFSNDAILQFKGNYGSALELTSDVTVLAGETSGTGTINLNGNDVGFNGEIFKVSMKGIRLVNFEDLLDDDGNPINLPIPTGDDNIEINSNVIEVLVHQNFEEGKSNIAFGWDDASDFDIRLTDSTGTVVDNSESGANPEALTLDDTLADGDYTLGIIYYSIVDDSSNYTFKIRTSDGATQIVQGSLSGYVEDAATLVDVFTITKSGSSYTITQL